MDLVEVDRIRRVLRRHGTRFLERILTVAEREYVLRFADPAERFAGRWAAKEAGMKALGTGLASGVGWHDLEIFHDERGKPLLRLHAQAARIAERLNAQNALVSITHSETAAAAVVILERADQSPPTGGETP
jgi:holo-[acyl-carrier protein] synthase